MDYRYILLIVTLIILLGFLLLRDPEKTVKIHQDQDSFDGDYRIIVNDDLYKKFVNIILDYANKADDTKTRTLYVYAATFQIFNLNFHPKRLERLDQSLKGVKMYRDDITYPSWTKYHNLQAAIANLVSKELTNTEREFTGDKNKDREMVEVYLSTVFDLFNVVRVRD